MSKTSDLNQRLAAAIGALWARVPEGERVVEIVDSTVTASEPSRLRVYTLRDVKGRSERCTYDFAPDGLGGYRLEERGGLKKPHPLAPTRREQSAE